MGGNWEVGKGEKRTLISYVLVENRILLDGIWVFFFCMILMDDVMICISMRACMHMWRFECFDYLGREEEEEGRKGLRFEK